MGGLTLTDIHKSFGQVQAVAGVSFSIAVGEIIALLGPSGCGKSTVLAIISGLEIPDRGEVLWDGDSLAGVPIHKRNFGLMFQDFVLFPHLNVTNNVSFGLRMANLPEAAVRQRVEEVLELVGLPGYGSRDVNTLSGGEQQRVALARSLAPQPRLLMLDEPLGSLDRNLRERLVVELGQILRRTRQTAIYVTHDQEEAFALADRVVVMNKGSVEQIDAPQRIYREPASVFVAQFLGMRNLIPGEVQNHRGKYEVDTPIGLLPLPHPAEGKVTVLLHPGSVHPGGSGPMKLEGVLASVSFRGSTTRAVVTVRDIPLEFEFPSHIPLGEPGENIQLSFDPTGAIQIFPHS